VLNRPIIPKEVLGKHMAANQVVLYLDKEEDALLFALLSVRLSRRKSHSTPAMLESGLR
jgi:hypothetical protein